MFFSYLPLYYQGMFNPYSFIAKADDPHSPRRICYYFWSQVNLLLKREISSSHLHFNRMLPFSLSGAVQSALSGMVVTRTGSYRPIIWGGWAVMTIGWGLMVMLDSTSGM